jgi:aerobic carbon-monoxide dehydrogenase medium subunit
MTMAFYRPASLDEAVGLLASHEGARCLAGGATLVAMMNARLVEPTALVSLSDIAALRGIARLADGSVRIGAMSRHAETARSDLFQEGQRIVPLAAGRIANAVVRNMGTMGGSVAFADPAADYLPALAASDAIVEIVGPDGSRELQVLEFVEDWYTTNLAPGEIIAGFRVPPAPPGSRAHFEKLDRSAGDFAIASVALVLAVEDGRCTAARVAIGGCAPAPVRRREAEALLEGSRLEPKVIAEAGKFLADATDPVDDIRASADYRRAVVPRLLAKAVARVLAA